MLVFLNCRIPTSKNRRTHSLPAQASQHLHDIESNRVCGVSPGSFGVHTFGNMLPAVINLKFVGLFVGKILRADYNCMKYK